MIHRLTIEEHDEKKNPRNRQENKVVFRNPYFLNLDSGFFGKSRSRFPMIDNFTDELQNIFFQEFKALR
jgi:hypothetical protein